MKAVAARNGEIEIIEVAEPTLLEGHVYVRTEFSGISPGTEMTMLGNSKDEPVMIGYSAVGIVERVGQKVEGIQPGQRVACYGGPYVHHAEYLTVPANLVAVVPDHVDAAEAAFAGLGAIGIHALRVADLRFGESVFVVGLGILGQIIAQVASAAAYHTVGLDLNEQRVELLKQSGIERCYTQAEQVEEQLAELTGGKGFDCVVLCAGGPGAALINQSLTWLRDRGKIVIVGDLSMEFSRSLMFSKEAQVLISRAGGPGRYDVSYERDNQDYPYGHVRWTEGRNVGEYVRLLAEKRINISPLITSRLPLEHTAEAFEKYRSASPGMGTLLEYGTKA